MFLLLNRKEDCVLKIKISLFIITKENVSLMTSDYVIMILTSIQADSLRRGIVVNFEGAERLLEHNNGLEFELLKTHRR